MFKTRIRKILGDVWARKGRTALVSIAIFIGVAGVISLSSLRDIIVGQLREDIQEDDLAMILSFVRANIDADVDNDAVLNGLLENVPGLTDIQGLTLQTPAYLKVEGAEDFEQIYLSGYTTPLDQLVLEPMRLIDGAYPVEGANEIVLEKRAAENLGLAVGDAVTMRILSPSRDGSGEIATEETWTISGIVFHPYNTDPRTTGFSLLEDAHYITGVSVINALQGRFIDYPTAQLQQDVFVDYLANQTPFAPDFTLLIDPEQSDLVTGAEIVGNLMSFLAIVALFVSGFLVINVISSIVVEQKRQIGVMKSLGASRWDNFFIYTGIALMYGIIGVVPGVIVGIPGGNAASHALAPQLNTVLEGFQISPSAIITGIIMGLLIPVFASLLPVWSGTRVKILDAMTDLGISSNYGSGPIARLIKLLPLPVTVRQGLSNVSQKKGRLAFTVVTLAIAAGAFMGIFAVFSSITSGFNLFLDLFNVDVFLQPNETRDPDELTLILEEDYQSGDINLISTIDPGFFTTVEFEGYDPPVSAGGPPGILIYGIVSENGTAFNLSVDEGEMIGPDNFETGAIFSTKLALSMGKDIGDHVVMVLPGNKLEIEIIGLSEFPIDQVWMDWRTVANASGFTIGAPRANEYFTVLTVDGYEGEVGAIGLDDQFAGFIPLDDGEFFTIGEPQVVITSAFAESGGYAVGDTLELVASTGNSAEYTISGIITLPPMMQQAAPEIPDELIGIYWSDLAELEGVSLDGKPVPQTYFINSTYDDPTVDEIADMIDTINEGMLERGIPVTMVNWIEQKELFVSTFQTIQVVLQMVAGLIALVGALGLLTTLSMSVFERQKEIGVMRSIGASAMTIAMQFLTEGLVVGLIAWVIGIPLAYAIQVTILEITSFSDTFPVEFSVEGTVIGLIGMLIITTVASLSPALSAARKTVSEVLRYQ